jgi:hypothetical protein
MTDGLRQFFYGGVFMPHGHCYYWDRGVVSLHVVSDALIFLAYMTIPITLLYFVKKRKDVPFDWMFACFGVFIVACGTTHLLEIWNLWHSAYWLSGAIKGITALASVGTAILLVRLVPTALALPSPEDLRRANARLAEESSERQRANQFLAEKAQELEKANSELAEFNRLMVDRELRMIELKTQMNDLLREVGRPPAYD